MSLLGVREYIIIGLIALLAVTGFLLKVAYGTIDEQKITIHDLELNVKELKGAIERQNAAVDAAGKERQSLQDRIDDLNRKTPEIITKYVTIKGEVNGAPVAKSCTDAMKELRSTNERLAKEWNR